MDLCRTNIFSFDTLQRTLSKTCFTWVQKLFICKFYFSDYFFFASATFVVAQIVIFVFLRSFLRRSFVLTLIRLCCVFLSFHWDLQQTELIIDWLTPGKWAQLLFCGCGVGCWLDAGWMCDGSTQRVTPHPLTETLAAASASQAECDTSYVFIRRFRMLHVSIVHSRDPECYTSSTGGCDFHLSNTNWLWRKHEIQIILYQHNEEMFFNQLIHINNC